MKLLQFVVLVFLLFSAPSMAISAETPQKGFFMRAANIRANPTSATGVAQRHASQSIQGHMEHMKKGPAKSALEPAEGASVKILSPKEGQAIIG